MILSGAGEGNRTLVFSLEGCCSTIELHPHGEAEPRISNIKSEISNSRLGRDEWGLQDSNLCRRSQRIYSPPPLTTRANPQILLSVRCCAGFLVKLVGRVIVLRRARTRASGGIRTHDRLITNQLLCQLSYAGGTHSRRSDQTDPRPSGQIRGFSSTAMVRLGRAECSDPSICDKTELAVLPRISSGIFFPRPSSAPGMTLCASGTTL